MTSYQRRNNGDGPADLTTKAPHFFKIIMPQTLQEGKLLIPKKFISKYGVDLSDMTFLTIPNGTKWKVKLTKRDGEVWFQNGQCEFASCHALTLGHLLVFRYEGNSQFSVLIFDATATKIEYPLDDQPQVRRMEDSESDDNSIEIMDGFMPSQKTGEKPPLPCPLPHKRAKTNPTSSDLQAGDTHFRPEGPKSKGSMLEKSKMVFGVSFTKGEGSGSAHGVGGNRVGCTSGSLVKLESDCSLDDVSFSHHQCPKKDGGVAENLVRANAFKSKNPLLTVIIHPSYINGKDHAIIIQLSELETTKKFLNAEVEQLHKVYRGISSH